MINGKEIKVNDKSITKSIVNGFIPIDTLPNNGPELNDELLKQELGFSEQSIRTFKRHSKLLMK